MLLGQPGLDLVAVRTDLHKMRIDKMAFDGDSAEKGGRGSGPAKLDRELYSATVQAMLQVRIYGDWRQHSISGRSSSSIIV